MDAQCSCIWRTINSSVKRTTRRSFVSHTHTHTEREIQSERVFHNMQNWHATCRRYSLLYFPVKITKFLWNSSAFKNSASGRSYCANDNLIGRHSPIIIPVLISANQFERTHTMWLIFMNPAALLSSLVRFILLLVV